MKLLKVLLVGLLLVAFLLVVAVFFVPADRYIPEIEKQLSTEMEQPVRIGHLSVALLPFPHMDVRDVRMGEKAEVVLDSVDVMLSMAALTERRCLINNIVVKKGALGEAPTDALLEWMTSDDMNTEPPFCTIEGLTFERLSLQIPDFPLEELRGDVSFDEFNNPTGIKLYVPRFDLTTDIGLLADGSVHIVATTPGWEMPEIPDLRLEQVRVEGVIEGSAFNMHAMSARLLGVGLSGKGRLDWSTDWDLRGEVDVAGVSVHQHLKALENRTLAFGKVHGSGLFSARSKEPETLIDHLLLEADITSSDFGLQTDPNAQAMLKMDKFNTHLAYNADAIRLQHVDAHLAGGGLTGAVTLLPDSATLRLDLTTRGLNPQPVVQAFDGSLVVSGVLDADVRGILNLDRLNDFPVGSRVEGKFQMRDGELSEAKLVTAVNKSIKEANGDVIQFKEVGSDVVMDGAGYHLSGLKLAASLFNADGHLNITPQEHLEGKLDAAIQGTAKLVSLPLLVSGTIGSPVVRPAGSVVAGAAIGTALLGPVGTAIGIKAGGLLEQALGSKAAPPTRGAAANDWAVSGWSGGPLPTIKPMAQPEKLPTKTTQTAAKLDVKSSPVGTSAPPLAQVGTAHVDQPSPPVVTKVAPLPSEAAKVFVSPKPASAVVAASKPPSPAIRPQPESTAQARKPSTNSTPVAAVQAGKVTATSPVQSGVRQKTVPSKPTPSARTPIAQPMASAPAVQAKPEMPRSVSKSPQAPSPKPLASKPIITAPKASTAPVVAPSMPAPGPSRPVITPPKEPSAADGKQRRSQPETKQ